MSNDQIEFELSQIEVRHRVYEVAINREYSLGRHLILCSTHMTPEQAEQFVLTAMRLKTFDNPLTIIKEYNYATN